MWRVLPVLLLPVLDIWTLFQLDSVVGFWPMLAWCVLALVFGLWLARRARDRIMRRLGQRGDPAMVTRADASLVSDDLLMAFGGLALAFPGLASDFIGLGLLLRPTRRALLGWLSRRVTRGPERADGNVEIYPPGTIRPPTRKRPPVIDIH